MLWLLSLTSNFVSLHVNKSGGITIKRMNPRSCMRGGRTSVGPKDRHEPVVPGTHYAEEEWSFEALAGAANPQLLNSVELETKLCF